MTDRLHDYSGKCGSCKFFAYRVLDMKLKRWGGKCKKHRSSKITNYHDASQKACKKYSAEEQA